MATISSSLKFQDEMSSKMDSLARKLDMAAVEAKIAKYELDALENAQKQWKITLNQLENAQIKDKDAIAKAREEYLKALNAYDNGVLKAQKYEAQMASLEQQINKNTQGFESMSGKIVTLSAAFQLFNQAVGFIKGVNAKINEYVQYTQTQMQAEDQLSIIAKQRMALNDDEVRSLYELAAAQQRVGVVGDEATIAGMAGVAAFTTQKSSIQALTPVMDDLAVKMYGYNVTAENMDAVSKSLGKALQGDVGQLSRMGVKINDVTKKRLMSLREEERAVELAKIIKSVTGDMNEEMVKTPFGQMTQANNRLGDSYEKLGAALLPLQAQMAEVWSNLVEKIINNLDTIVPIALTALGVITAGFIALNATAISAAISAAAAWIAATAPLWIVVGVISAISTALNAMGLSFQEQAENLLISFNWIITGIKNIWIAIQNTWTFAENVIKNFSDTSTLILMKFFGWVASKLEGIARLIDMVFKTNLSEAVNNFANQANRAEDVLTKRIQNNSKSYKSFEANDFNTNQAKAQGFMNSLKGGALTNRALLGASGTGKFGGLEGLTTNTSGGTALKTQNQGDIGIKEEDMELLHDLATEKFAQYYQTLTPTLTIPSMVIHETADVNEVIGAVTSSITGFVRSSTYNTDTGSQAILPA